MNVLKSHAAGTTDSDVFEKLPQALGEARVLVGVARLVVHHDRIARHAEVEKQRNRRAKVVRP